MPEQPTDLTVLDQAKEDIETTLVPKAISTYMNIMLNAAKDPSNARMVADKVMEMAGLYTKVPAGGSHQDGLQITASINADHWIETVKALNTIAEGVSNDPQTRDVSPASTFAGPPTVKEAPKTADSVPTWEAEDK